MSEGVFTIAAKRPIRAEMTISRNTGLGTSNSATWFSLGAGTSITPESYDTMSIYIGAAGTGTFLIGEQPETMDLHRRELSAASKPARVVSIQKLLQKRRTL